MPPTSGPAGDWMPALEPPPEGWTPLEAVAVVKCLDEAGGMALITRFSDGVTSWEAIGMMTVAADLERDKVLDAFRDG